jgi:hypothetical protein
MTKKIKQIDKSEKFKRKKLELIFKMKIHAWQGFTNSKIIYSLIKQFNKLDSKWEMDPRHSYWADEGMRTVVIFPNISFNDGESLINIGLFLHNSYGASKKVNAFWGGLRNSDGAAFVFSKILSEHYEDDGIPLDILVKQIGSIQEQIPIISERIHNLQKLLVSKSMIEDVEAVFGEEILQYVKDDQNADAWILYNHINFYISHRIDRKFRLGGQKMVSQIFKL